jgi:DNA-binding NarL/FixJ family response regulator
MHTRVAVVDDHVSVRQMLSIFLKGGCDYLIVGEAGSGLEALRMMEKTKFDVAIVDLLLPELSGVDVIRALRTEHRQTRVVVYTGALNRELVCAALQEKPHGFVHKQEPLETLRTALRTVCGGCCFLSAFATQVSDRAASGMGPPGELSGRDPAGQHQIAGWRGRKEIAHLLAVAPKTVEHYRSAVMRKLDTHDVASLTRLAVRGGLVGLE